MAHGERVMNCAVCGKRLHSDFTKFGIKSHGDCERKTVGYGKPPHTVRLVTVLSYYRRLRADGTLGK